MKKVFAFLSVFALTIALVGLAVRPVKADVLFTKDPTLSENDIPMYIMDSIYTTFPQYYDNNAKQDENWGGAARMYPWNEIKLQVKQMDAEGSFTGKEYAIYFTGSLNGKEAGAGNNVLFYKLNESGELQLGRMSGGKWASTGLPMDPSLSHMRTNITGQQIQFDALKLWSDGGGNLYNRMFVFDGDGRMVRGLAPDGGYVPAGADGALENVFAPEYCYVDGVATKIEEGTVCDVEEVTNEETGETTKVTKYINERFVWQYFPEAEFDADTVNKVPYLSEGWDAQKWDYATKEDGGYVCIAFTGAEGGAFKLTEAQLAVYTATCEANGVEAPTASTVREMARNIIVPVGGWTYDFGYLDKGKPGLANKFMDMFISGYYYGRNVNEEGKGMAYQKTFNFSAKPLYFKEKVLGGASYQTLEGQNVIEVMQGNKFNPAALVQYVGMAKYWGEPAEGKHMLESYVSDSSKLDLYIKENGVTVVQPNTGFTSFEGMRDEFMADWNNYLAKREGYALNEEGKLVNKDGAEFVPVATPTLENKITTTSEFYTRGNNTFATMWGTKGFLNEPDMYAKWSWMFEYMNLQLDKNNAGMKLTGPATATYVSSPGNFTYSMWAFLAESPEITGWPASKSDWSNGKAREWLDTRTNVEKWDQYTIDTATDHVDKVYDVEFRAVNQDTQNESTLTLRFVVVDEYTPILTVNKEATIYAPTQSGDKLEMPVIDVNKLCNAFNAKYNGNIKGDDISYKIHYTSETLDFNAPTEGVHKVTARVYNNIKFAEKTFEVVIEDMTAPRAFTRDITIGVGEFFEPTMGITFAYDAVDGNLLNNDSSSWLYADMKNVDITKPGSYKINIEISDSKANITEVNYTLTVVQNPALEDILTEVNGNKEKLESMEATFTSQLAELAEKVANIEKYVNDEIAAKCGSKSAIMVELLAAASLLGVFLRKRH